MTPQLTQILCHLKMCLQPSFAWTRARSRPVLDRPPADTVSDITYVGVGVCVWAGTGVVDTTRIGEPACATCGACGTGAACIRQGGVFGREVQETQET